ncbi:MAG: hypothetical protein E7473_08930 [Ruminococcaceae bacterium]|nr:hypothetical protein [Oscillospiraceae bacterium]
MKRKTALLLVFILLFCGCGERSSDMFAMPEIPETQKRFVDAVETVLDRGYEYVELRSGINRQPLQLIDLDNDGEEEGIAFLRDSRTTYKTYIYIFKEFDSELRLYDVIEGPANDLFAVSYTDIVGEEGCEIVAEWDSGDLESKILRVYKLGESGVEMLLNVDAMNYLVSDLNGDEKKEITVVAKRGEKTYANVYVSENGKTEVAADIPLTSRGSEILRMKTDSVTQKRKGVIIERRAEFGTVIEVIAYNGKDFVNMIPDGEVCLSDVRCEDVDGDGIIDIPEEPFESYSENAANRCYKWNNISANGEFMLNAFTYHSFAENWFLLMPVSWANSVRTRRTIEQDGCVKIEFTTFEPLNDDEGNVLEVPLFTIYVLSGENKARFAEEKGGFTVSERGNEMFRAEIRCESYLGTKIDEGFIKSIFRHSESEWISEALLA